MAGYATKTKVSVAQSKAEIEDTLNRFGIRNVGYFSDERSAIIIFKREGQPYSISVDLPNPNDEEFKFTPARRHKRTDAEANAAWEQACRVKWRELALLIKAKLVAISNDAATFEDEFLAYAMLPNNSTVGQWAKTQIADMVAQGQMPELFPRGQAALAERNR